MSSTYTRHKLLKKLQCINLKQYKTCSELDRHNFEANDRVKQNGTHTVPSITRKCFTVRNLLN